MIKFFPIIDIDLLMLAANPVPEQVLEVAASHGEDIYTVAKSAAEKSSVSRSVYYDGRLVGVFGVVPMHDIYNTGIPWLLTTGNFARPLLKATHKVIAILLEEFDVLENYIDARYEKSLRWAKWAGFEVDGTPTFLGKKRLPFYKVRIG